MQAFGETLFDVVYLVLVITVGIKMIRQSKGDRQYRLFGIMAVWGAEMLFIWFPGHMHYVQQGWKIIQRLLASVNLLPRLQ